MLFTSEGIMNMKNEKWRNDHSPIDPNGEVYVDGAYSRAYLRHLFASKEMLGAMIASLHNLGFYIWLMRTAREKIVAGEFSQWKNLMVKKLQARL
jgi:queuine tRNA-ribosyltransferase